MSIAPAILIISPLVVGIAALWVWTEFFQHRIGVTPVQEPMLRSPGESQRKRIEELNDAIVLPLMAASFIPIMHVMMLFSVARAGGTQGPTSWVIAFIVSAVAVFFSGRRLVKIFRELRNRRLGYAGECLVAERLLPLLKTNCLIFHDCPADEHGNIDHIVLTPSGVYAIETKTRRKRLSTDRGTYPHQVIYDGDALIYPHGRETFALDQARRQAQWLSQLFSKAVGEPVPVQPVLALPGWMVERTERGDVAVVNPKQLPALIRQPRTQPTAAALKRMRQLGFALEARCRDVPFPGTLVAQEAKKAARSAFLKKKTQAHDERAAGTPVPASARRLAPFTIAGNSR